MSQQPKENLNLDGSKLNSSIINQRSTNKMGHVHFEQPAPLVAPQVAPPKNSQSTEMNQTVLNLDSNNSTGNFTIKTVFPPVTQENVPQTESTARIIPITVDKEIAEPSIQTTIQRSDRFQEIGILADLTSQWTPGNTGDLLFVVNGQEITAYKWILSQLSPVFRSLFQAKQTNRYVIENLNPDAFKAMLDFLKDGNVRRLDGHLALYATELLEVAHKFNLRELKEKSETFLISNALPKLSYDSIIDFLLYTDKNQAERLKEGAIDFIASNCSGIVDSDDFEKITRYSPRFALNVYRDVKNKQS